MVVTYSAIGAEVVVVESKELVFTGMTVGASVLALAFLVVGTRVKVMSVLLL